MVTGIVGPAMLRPLGAIFTNLSLKKHFPTIHQVSSSEKINKFNLSERDISHVSTIRLEQEKNHLYHQYLR